MITQDITKAIKALENDELVGIPTETVYGLAANAYSEEAVRKIYALKNRPAYNPLIVHIASVSFLPHIAQNIPQLAFDLADRFWPGPLTLLLEKQAHIPEVVTAGKPTVAVRVPDHLLTRSLLEQLDYPLVAPSANPFGSISPTSAEHVWHYFGASLGVILDGGPCAKGIESTIIGFEHGQPVLYRHGSIAVADIEKVTGKLALRTLNDQSPEAPGMLTRHYAPNTPTYLTNNVMELAKTFRGKKIGTLTFSQPLPIDTITHQEVLSPGGHLSEAAKNLYAALHRLDRSGLEVIITELLPETGLGATLNDKLRRATQKKAATATEHYQDPAPEQVLA